MTSLRPTEAVTDADLYVVVFVSYFSIFEVLFCDIIHCCVTLQTVFCFIMSQFYRLVGQCILFSLFSVYQLSVSKRQIVFVIEFKNIEYSGDISFVMTR